MPTHDDLVTPEVLDQEYLHALYQSAYMDCVRDSDGDVVVTDGGFPCFVLLPQSGDLIRLAAYLPLETDVPRGKILEWVNEINDKYVVTRASIGSGEESGLLCFEHYIFLNGGVSTRSVVLGTKKFIEVTRQAIREHGMDLLGQRPGTNC